METPINESTEVTAQPLKESAEKSRITDVSVSLTPKEPAIETKAETPVKAEVKATEQTQAKPENQRKYESKEAQEIARMTRQKYRLREEAEALRKENAELKAKYNQQFTQEHFATPEAYKQWQEQNKPVLNDVDEDAEEALQGFQAQIQERYKTPEELQEYNKLVEENRPLLNRIDSETQQYIMRSPVGADMLEFFMRQPHLIEKLLKTHKFDRPEVLRNLQAHFMGVRQEKQAQPKAVVQAEEKKPIGSVAGGKPINAGGAKSLDDMLAERRSNRIKTK